MPPDSRVTLLPDTCTAEFSVYHVSFRTVSPNWTPVPAPVKS
jgi:hypothetical protein